MMKTRRTRLLATLLIISVVLLVGSASIPVANALGSPSCYNVSCTLASPANQYVGVEGFQTHNSHIGVKEVDTTVSLFGPSYLGSSTLYAGWSTHVSDSKWSVDYLLQFYAYYTSNGKANVVLAIWVTCAGLLYDCGPAFGNCYPFCSPSAILIYTASSSAIGQAGDPVEVVAKWDNTYGWSFDYRDTNNNPYYWTVATWYPTGNYATMQHVMVFGDEKVRDTSPVNYAYYFQVGFLFSAVPQNIHWSMQALNTWYIASGSSTITYMNHATTLTWTTNVTCPPIGSSVCYWSYWKEVWNVGQGPAQVNGAAIGGGGTSSQNALSAAWNGLSQPGNQNLW